MSGCYERGGERTGVGIGTAATWRRREGGVQSVWHAHEQGPSAGSGMGAIEAGSGRARSAEQRSEERRGGSGRVGPIWKREGARGSRLEHVGRPRRRKELGRAQENNADFDLKRISKLNTI
jgi:hypothetical protein